MSSLPRFCILVPCAIATVKCKILGSGYCFCRKVDEKAIQLHAIASLKAVLEATNVNPGAASTSAAIKLRESSLSLIEDASSIKDREINRKDFRENGGNESVLLSYPNIVMKKLFYLLKLPINILLWLTLPDPKQESCRKFFIVTFLGSIIWIAIFSYLMVWWSSIIGQTLHVPSEVLGLTFLATGTSISDLITSVFLARRGCGSMAVLSSVRSKIFDITVGLPFSWLLYNLIFGCPMTINSNGVLCSVVILFMIVVFLVLSILFFNWKINPAHGYIMFMFYVLFVICSVLFKYHLIPCFL